MIMKKITFAIIASVLFFAVSAMAEVTWSVSDGIGSATGNGECTVPANQELSRLDVAATDGVLTLTGDGISFTGDSPVVSVVGTNVFDVPLTSAGSLSFGRDLRHYNKDGGYQNSEYFLTEEYKTIFQNLKLSEYIPTSGLSAGGTIAEGSKYEVFHIKRGIDDEGEYLICQFQLDEAPATKCLIVKFLQSNNDVQAKVTDVSYRTTKATYEDVDEPPYKGSDFSVGEVNRNYGLATSVSESGYGIYSITFRYSAGTAYLAMKKDVEVDSLVVDDDVVVVADGGNIHAISADVLPAMEIDGSLTITNSMNLHFSNGLSGSGELYFGGCQNVVLSMPTENTYTAAGTYLPNSWTTVMYGGVLTSVTNVFVNEFHGSISGSGSMYHMKTNGNTIVCQLQQHPGDYLKCVYLELQQVSTNIQARVRHAYYAHKSLPLGIDFDTLKDGTPAEGNFERKGGSYFIKQFTLYLDADAPYDPSSLVIASFSGANTMAGGKIYQRGGAANITSKKGLSSNGGIYTVSDAGKLIFEVSGCYLSASVGGGKTELRATGGSSITSKNNYQFDYANQVISLDGSILELASQDDGKYYAAYDSGEYVNFITLANGSRISGLYPRVGYAAVSPVWTITGTSPSILDTGLFTYSVNNQLTTFDVEDVTRDDEADFIVNGPIQPNGASSELNMWLRKTGSGTMRLNDHVRSRTPLCLDEGTLELGASDILCGTHPSIIPAITTDPVSIQFGGGALAGAAGTSNVVGYVSVTNNSQIVLGEGVVFTFADSSEYEWADDMTLEITGEFTKRSVRFGTSNTALTSQQQSALRVKGQRAALDPEGYVRCNAGLIFVIR